MEPIALKKMTTKEVCGDLSVPEKPEVLYSVYGVVTHTIDKPSKHNKTQKLLMGRFEAMRASDRQSFSSTNLYLPDNNFQEQLAAANRGNSETGELKEISFAFKVSFKAGASPTGYVFTVEPVLDHKAQDALADVRKQIDFDKILPRLVGPASEKVADKAPGKTATK